VNSQSFVSCSFGSVKISHQIFIEYWQEFHTPWRPETDKIISMNYALRQFFAIALSVGLFLGAVKSTHSQQQEGVDQKGQMASMLGMVLTGIGIMGLVKHTPPCVTEGIECGKMALDIGMTAGGILAMLAGGKTQEAASGEPMPEMAGAGGAAAGGEMPTPDLGNFNLPNFNTNTNGNNPYVNTFCPNGPPCSVPDDIYAGLDKLASGLADGSMSAPNGMSPDAFLESSYNDLAKLEDAVKQLENSLTEDVDNSTMLGERSSNRAPASGGFDFGGFTNPFAKLKKDNASQAPVRINGLDAEDMNSGKKLSLFERATRRYQGTRDYPRAFTVARMELLRKRAKEFAKRGTKKDDKVARSPASTPSATIKNDKN
jgi:hypothetical protein